LQGPLNKGFAVLVCILILFAIDDNNNKQETSALDGLPHQWGKADQAVRFHKHVQLIAPPLRSNLESWETGMSLHACILCWVINESDST